ncbi:hypothetical protein FOB58_003360 [Candida parapsilosis]|uniref:Protein MUM2 n=2 Tax=Candida parapsilosis TaxID=5480 RepID=G8B689_CANPC|nr:uncharacterized protein CPAR2_100080 [Candida parapsilosis]KAF6047950.1 hypothetical protein FOB59_002993 [Candida parapsilosis]KAF6050083.1 hypothetical protein FOB58_003360 [Candida parapsilosis]KAF6057946.1 hypothetical protein FOB60_002501 [Candida parapsilosis]KAF6065347.1 hypothetical protein FOB61_001417 [Candida parapsilosis]CCE39970.1 hypothetical protein CPAR2_100080 [Candida parapsilosis]
MSFPMESSSTHQSNPPQSCDNTIDSNQTVNTSYMSSNEYQSVNWQQAQHHQQQQKQQQQQQQLHNGPSTQQYSLPQNAMQSYPYQSEYTPMKLWNQSTYSNQNWQNKTNPFQPLARDQDNGDGEFFDSKTNDKRSTTQYNTNKYMKNSMLNAPSYVPYGARYPATPNSTINKAAIDDENGTDLKEEVQKLKNELILKNQMIKNLTDQIGIMIKNKNSKAYNEVKEDASDARSPVFKMPQNHYQLFQDLSKTLQEKCQELDDVNQRMEIVLVANHISNNTAVGYDVEELSHKLLYKMNQLQTENDELVKMVSLSNKSSLLVEIGMLKQQIAQINGDAQKDNKMEDGK